MALIWMALFWIISEDIIYWRIKGANSDVMSISPFSVSCKNARRYFPLCNTTRHAVERERGWSGVGAAVGGLEAGRYC